MHHSARAVAYTSCQWALTLIVLVTLSLRIYSRTWLTRSIGSDDFAIVVAFSLDTANNVFDLEAFINGWGQHGSELSPGQFSSEQKWEYLGFLTGYIDCFLIRTSVILFVLRLLPAYKRWQQCALYALFSVNVAITLFATLVFGLSCIPFKACWDAVPGSRSMSKELLVASNSVNAGLACVCDIGTAVVPVLLLWNVQMRSRTKTQLNILFALGLVTAVLSVGRAATISKKSLTEDTTYNTVPRYYMSGFEYKLGMIFACGPAVRQLIMYRHRTNTFLPTKDRQYPNEDFQKMRWRINLRDIFWYRKASIVGGRVYEAQRTFMDTPRKSTLDGSGATNKSALGLLEERVRNFFQTGKFTTTVNSRSTDTHNSINMRAWGSDTFDHRLESDSGPLVQHHSHMSPKPFPIKAPNKARENVVGKTASLSSTGGFGTNDVQETDDDVHTS